MKVPLTRYGKCSLFRISTLSRITTYVTLYMETDPKDSDSHSALGRLQTSPEVDVFAKFLPLHWYLPRFTRDRKCENRDMQSSENLVERAFATTTHLCPYTIATRLACASSLNGRVQEGRSVGFHCLTLRIP